MICKKCGAEIGDYASFCTYCGNPVGNHGVDLNKTSSSEAESAPPPGYSDPISRDDREPTQQPGMGYIPEFNRTQTGWQNPSSGYIPAGSQNFQYSENGSTWEEIKRAGYIIGNDGRRYSIGWLKFILYVQLFASAVFSLFNAISFLTGAGYGGNAELVYEFYSGLFGLDMVMGIFSLLLCAAAVLVRFMLSGLRQIGPWAYLGLYLANLVMSVIYLSVFSGITGISIGELIDARTVVNMLTSIVMLVVNFVYFRNRSSVFKK
ncbi:MAG: zinc ribbon domain-containing protein [Oscillospiraceae bacterium]|nr:zinc ribbon domain-containing protein [Oscillospiraceae bacterium]